MKQIRLLLVALFIFALVGCDGLGSVPANPTAIAPQPSPTGTEPNATNTPSLPTIAPTRTIPAPTVTLTRTSTRMPGPSATPTDELRVEVPTPSIAPHEVATATLVAQLQETAIAGVEPTSTPDANGMSPFAGIDGVAVLQLTGVPAEGEYWVAYSTGSRRFEETPQRHFVIAFQHVNNGWEEKSRIELENSDYVSEGSVTQVNLEPTRVWLTVESGVGAHGGCFDLVNFDGNTLSNRVSSCASSPGAGSVRDLDGDGFGEVILNASDSYVFCYACGVSLINFTVMRWDGSRLVTVALEDLPTSLPAEVKSSNDRAVDLFDHSMMKDALAEIEKAYALDPTNNTLKWNRALIKLHADARAAHVRESPYPLLANVFYGDFPAAADILRDYTVDEVMMRADLSPLVIGTAAENNALYLISYINTGTTTAIAIQPSLASAYFLRGWAYYLDSNHDPEALADLKQAATLAPDDPLFKAGLEFLQR